MITLIDNMFSFINGYNVKFLIAILSVAFLSYLLTNTVFADSTELLISDLIDRRSTITFDSNDYLYVAGATLNVISKYNSDCFIIDVDFVF